MSDPTPSELPDPSRALADALAKIHSLIRSVDDEQYVRAGLVGFASPLGAHVRHCIDHVDALLLGLQEVPDREIRYDRRERGTRIETDRTEAMESCIDRRNLVLQLDRHSLADPVRVLALVSPDAPEMRFESTALRELLYVFHHTVHHVALMAAQAEHLGASLEKDLGRAPATLAADQDP
ncbi:MAG: DinB family protein [Planctomycetota bacterium]|nr:DinB family protein [Planctomycetota bacterium]